METLEDMLQNLAALEGWEARYEYVIELGRGLVPFPPEAMTEANLVRGCTSTVYMMLDWQNDKLRVQLTSDALIVNGLLALVYAAYSGQSRAGAAAVDLPQRLVQSGLLEHLSPNRRHGFASVIGRIQAFIAA